MGVEAVLKWGSVSDVYPPLLTHGVAPSVGSIPSAFSTPPTTQVGCFSKICPLGERSTKTAPHIASCGCSEVTGCSISSKTVFRVVSSNVHWHFTVSWWVGWLIYLTEKSFDSALWRWRKRRWRVEGKTKKKQLKKTLSLLSKPIKRSVCARPRIWTQDL